MSKGSKLTKIGKAERKGMLKQLPRGSEFCLSGSVTILTVPDGSVTRVFSSVAAEDEPKLRRKVGEYYALLRHDRDPCGGLVLPGKWHADDVAGMLFNYSTEPVRLAKTYGRANY